jgi:hypothetical protein
MPNMTHLSDIPVTPPVALPVLVFLPAKARRTSSQHPFLDIDWESGTQLGEKGWPVAFGDSGLLHSLLLACCLALSG